MQETSSKSLCQQQVTVTITSCDPVENGCGIPYVSPNINLYYYSLIVYKFSFIF
jgi:hypothetical protein